MCIEGTLPGFEVKLSDVVLSALIKVSIVVNLSPKEVVVKRLFTGIGLPS